MLRSPDGARWNDCPGLYRYSSSQKTDYADDARVVAFRAKQSLVGTQQYAKRVGSGSGRPHLAYATARLVMRAGGRRQVFFGERITGVRCWTHNLRSLLVLTHDSGT